MIAYDHVAIYDILLILDFSESLVAVLNANNALQKVIVI